MTQQMKYFYELTISSSPHIHSPQTTTTIMRDVLIALIPALLGSVWFFGFRVLLVTLISMAACVLFDLSEKLQCLQFGICPQALHPGSHP